MKRKHKNWTMMLIFKIFSLDDGSSSCPTLQSWREPNLWLILQFKLSGVWSLYLSLLLVVITPCYLFSYLSIYINLIFLSFYLFINMDSIFSILYPASYIKNPTYIVFLEMYPSWYQENVHCILYPVSYFRNCIRYHATRNVCILYQENKQCILYRVSSYKNCVLNHASFLNQEN